MDEIRPVGQQPLSMNGDSSKKDSPEKIKKALTEFESLFIEQMLKTMRETIQKGDLFHGGPGEDIYTSMFDAELSKVMAKSGGIGLEKAFEKQLTGDYEVLRNYTRPREVKPETAEPAAAQTPAIKEQSIGLKFPVQGKVSSNFGLRADPFTGDMKFHHGVDIAAREGRPIYPASAGKVIFSGEKGGYGKVVEILHDNGLITRYGHNSKNLVKEGDIVTPSDTIAYVGSTGRSTGPHVHFEVLKDGGSIDPRMLFKG